MVNPGPNAPFLPVNLDSITPRRVSDNVSFVIGFLESSSSKKGLVKKSLHDWLTLRGVKSLHLQAVYTRRKRVIESLKDPDTLLRWITDYNEDSLAKLKEVCSKSAHTKGSNLHPLLRRVHASKAFSLDDDRAISDHLKDYTVKLIRTEITRLLTITDKHPPWNTSMGIEASKLTKCYPMKHWIIHMNNDYDKQPWYPTLKERITDSLVIKCASFQEKISSALKHPYAELYLCCKEPERPQSICVDLDLPTQGITFRPPNPQTIQQGLEDIALWKTESPQEKINNCWHVRLEPSQVFQTYFEEIQEESTDNESSNPLSSKDSFTIDDRFMANTTSKSMGPLLPDSARTKEVSAPMLPSNVSAIPNLLNQQISVSKPKSSKALRASMPPFKVPEKPIKMVEPDLSLDEDDAFRANFEDISIPKTPNKTPMTTSPSTVSTLASNTEERSVSLKRKIPEPLGEKRVVSKEPIPLESTEKEPQEESMENTVFYPAEHVFKKPRLVSKTTKRTKCLLIKCAEDGSLMLKNLLLPTKQCELLKEIAEQLGSECVTCHVPCITEMLAFPSQERRQECDPYRYRYNVYVRAQHEKHPDFDTTEKIEHAKLHDRRQLIEQRWDPIVELEDGPINKVASALCDPAWQHQHESFAVHGSAVVVPTRYHELEEFTVEDWKSIEDALTNDKDLFKINCFIRQVVSSFPNSTKDYTL